MPIVISQMEILSPKRPGYDAAASTSKLTAPQKERRRALVVPREHGAWGMLLVPLATGAVVGCATGGRIAPVLLLTTAVLALFWLRTPIESWLGTGALRVQTRQERRLVLRVIVPLSMIATVAVSALLWQGKSRGVIWLGMTAGAAFAAQILLKRLGRTKRLAAEVVGELALTSTAAAAYCVATGRLDARAWGLWLLNWLFAADQIHFVWLTIRGVRAAGLGEKLRVGWSFLAGQIALGGMLTFSYYSHWLPGLTWIAFVPVLFRGLVWFAKRPQPIVIRRLGWTELAHALVFGVLLSSSFCLVP